MSVLVRSLIPGPIVQLLLPSQSLFVTKKRINHSTDGLGNQAEKKEKKEKTVYNIQQLVFAGRHRPNY